MKILVDYLSLGTDGGTAIADHATVDKVRIISDGAMFEESKPEAVLWPEDFVGGSALIGAIDLNPGDWLVLVVYHPVLEYQGPSGSNWQYGSRLRWDFSNSATPPSFGGLYAPNVYSDSSLIMFENPYPSGPTNLYLHERYKDGSTPSPLFLTRAELWVIRQ